MHMVGHDDGGVKLQAVAIETGQAGAHDFADIGTGQGAAAVAGIEPLLDAFVETGLVVGDLSGSPRFWIFLEPRRAFVTELDEFGVGQRVREAEGDPVACAIAPPMGKVAAVDIGR